MDNGFWDVAFLASPAGAMLATQQATRMLCDVSGWNPKRVAMGVAMVVQVFVWAAHGALAGFDWVSLGVAVLNIPVVYLSAVGTNTVTTARQAGAVLPADPMLRPKGMGGGGELELTMGRGSARWF